MPRKPTPHLQQRRQRWWESVPIVQIGWGAATFVGFAASVVVFVPSLDVSSSLQLNPNKPYSEIFIVSNSGNVALYNLRITCQEILSKDTAGNIARGNITTLDDRVEKLNPGQKDSFHCDLGYELNNELFSSKLDITITYETLIPFYTGTRSFVFTGVRTKYGSMKWFPIT